MTAGARIPDQPHRAAAPRPPRQRTVAALKEERDRLQVEAEIARLSHVRDAFNSGTHRSYGSYRSQSPSRQHLKEEWAGSWVGHYLDMIGDFAGGQMFGAGPISTTLDRRTGQDFPIFVNEVQLGAYRAPSRILCQTNGYAIGLMNGLCNYTAGTGFTYRVVVAKHAKKEADQGLIDEGQTILDEFLVRELWWELERELIWRTHEDGEYFLLHGQYDGDAWVRTREPEQFVYTPELLTAGVEAALIPSGTNPQAASFGVLTRYEDTQRVYGYWARDLTSADGEFLPAARVVHHKINTKRSIKRGLPDFTFSTFDALQLADKLRKNLTLGAAVQAALAGVIEHETATTAQVQDYIAVQSAANPPVYPGQTTTNPNGEPTVKLEPGSFYHTDSGSKFVPPPGAVAGDAHVMILAACLRAASVRHNAPDWLATGDSTTTNFAAALTAESPFAMSRLAEQTVMKERFRRTMRIVLGYAVERRRLPLDALQRLDVQVEAPSISPRNTLEEANENQVYLQMRVKSPQTISQQQDLNYEEEQANFEEHDERTGGAGQQLGLPPEDDDSGTVSSAPPKKPAPPAPAAGPGKASNPPGKAAESLEGRVGAKAAAAVYRAAAHLLEGFDESKVHRRDDGEFGTGGGSKKKT